MNFNIVGDYMPEREKLAYDLVLLRKNFLDYHSDLLHKTPAKWQTVRDALRPGELAVEITMCPDEMLLLGRDYPAPVSVQIPDELFTEIAKYNPTDAVNINEFYSPNSPLGKLTELLSPYLDGIHTLYISPTNLFSQFNFGAAPYNGRRLGDVFDVVQMTTTADIGRRDEKEKFSSADKALIYGGIDYGPIKPDAPESESDRLGLRGAIAEMRGGFGYLPHTLTEVKAIASIFDDCSLYTGTDASEDQIKATDWPRTEGVLHIATHGYSLPAPSYDESEGTRSRIATIRERSGLLMSGANYSLSGHQAGAEDGILTSKEIADFDMGNVELAVLSSCSSGTGDLTDTTGVVYGVANAMKSAGVKRVIATLWDIPDEASATAMRSFYRHLTSGIGVRQSLRAMRRDMMEQGFADPYYWASFVCLE